VIRAVKVARPGEERVSEARRLLAACLLIAVDGPILARASELASRELRAFDAIHLATAEEANPDEFVVYDRRLLRAAVDAGFVTASPGV
jgi:predicted nucleic acid-binding protein